MYRYCPSCGAEHRLGFTHCADCEVELVDDPPPQEAEAEDTDHVRTPGWTDLVEVYRVEPLQADLMGSILKGNGIPAVVQRAGSSAAYPFTVGDLGSATVLVPRDRAEEAVAVIRAAEEGGLESDDPEMDNDRAYEDPAGPVRLWDITPWFARGIAFLILLLIVVGGIATR